MDVHWTAHTAYNIKIDSLIHLLIEEFIKQKLKSIDLILLDLDEETLFKRRCESKADKYWDRGLVHLELELSRHYFEQYGKDLLISGLVINNTGINRTVELILRRIR